MTPDHLVLRPKSRRKLPPYRVLGCVMTRSRTQWCYGICRPHKGLGACGRLAPHMLRSTTQRAIERYKARMKAQEDRS